MINFLSNWIQQITISVIIVSIFEMILPNGSLKKYTKVVLGIYVVFSIISPFVDSKALYNIENNKIDTFLDNITKENDIKINQSSMDTRLEELYIKELKEDIAKRVKEYGYEVYKCNIEADLKSTSQTPGIHKIKLVLGANTGPIGKVQEVDIGINQTYEESKKEPDNDNTELKETSNDDITANVKSKEERNEDNIENIKQNLAENYDIPKNIILIKIK